MNLYYGDIHNHCGISYGHGPLEDALTNARLQLDFCSVTGHAHWPDIPEDDPRLASLVKYHKDGFAKLAAGWADVLDAFQQANEPGRFVTFPSFEWHDRRSGDYALYYRDGAGEILRPATIEDLHARLAGLNARGVAAMAIPHHLAYRVGHRGICWEHFDSRFSPVVEIISMHGCSESDCSPRPFLHTMGPSDGRGTAQAGLAAGHVFGFIGSTDHHSAFPGSYNHGRMAVWAEALTREAIWDAILARRTYALTGDRIELRFHINGRPMGSVIEPSTPDRQIEIAVKAGGAIDYVELVRNGEPIWRSSAHEHIVPPAGQTVHAKCLLEVGWRPEGRMHPWDFRFGIEAGEILAVEPRFRGPEVLAPTAGIEPGYAFSEWRRIDPRTVHVRTQAGASPTTSTSGTQGMCLEVKMPRAAKVWADFGGRRDAYPLEELLGGARSGYVGGFGMPAYRFARAAAEAEFGWSFPIADRAAGARGRDVYYVRVRQQNDQWAWSSPIWVTR